MNYFKCPYCGGHPVGEELEDFNAGMLAECECGCMLGPEDRGEYMKFKSKELPNEIFRRYRLKRGYTMRSLGEKIGRSGGYIGDIDSGRYPMPKGEIKERILDALQLSAKDLKALEWGIEYRKTPEAVREYMETLERKIQRLEKELGKGD